MLEPGSQNLHKMHGRPGFFIVFEGIDGAGKSTLAAMLAERLKAAGLPVLLTAEPSDGAAGKLIRASKTRLEPQEEARLFTEDRRNHVKEIILPALEDSTIVICDRYIYSSAAYQGARGLDPADIIEDNLSFAPPPDVTFLLELPLEIALSRIEENRREGFSAFEARENLKSVDAIYRGLNDPLIRRIDANRPLQIVMSDLLYIIRSMGVKV